LFCCLAWSGVEWSERWKEVDCAYGQCKATSHTANVTRAFCDDNFLQIALYPSHPLYSPDLNASDFCGFLFGHLKNHLQRQQFGSADEFLSGIRKVLDEISVDILEVIFRK
jgi:hypothetical protein